MNNFLQKGDAVYVPAPSPGVISGQCAMVGGRLFGVFAETAATGVTVALWRVGIFSLPKVSAQAWAVGDELYWDPVAALVTNVPTLLSKIGIAAAIAANPSANGAVLLVPAGGSGFPVETVAATVTAHAGGTKALATPLTAQANFISVCATIADSVLMPAAIAGRTIDVFNGGATAAQVFGQGTDTIDGVATATGVPLTQAKRAKFTCFATGNWVSAQYGVVSA